MEEAAEKGLRLSVVGADEALEEDLRAHCPAPHRLTVLSVAEAHKQLREVADLDVLLVAWPARPEAKDAFDAVAQTPRRVAIPLVALCRNHRKDRVEALSAGADVAIALPLHLPLLQERLKARQRLLGTDGRLPLAPRDEETIRIGPIQLNERNRTVRIDGERADLTPKEFDLLNFLTRHAGACCTRGQILDDVWGIDFETGTNMVDVYIHFLRQKLEEHGLDGVIRTERGEGYRLVVPRRTGRE